LTESYEDFGLTLLMVAIWWVYSSSKLINTFL